MRHGSGSAAQVGVVPVAGDSGGGADGGTSSPPETGPYQRFPESGLDYPGHSDTWPDIGTCRRAGSVGAPVYIGGGPPLPPQTHLFLRGSIPANDLNGEGEEGGRERQLFG